MDLYESFGALYKKALEETANISSAYERATIYTNIMNAIATLCNNGTEAVREDVSHNTTGDVATKVITENVENNNIETVAEESAISEDIVDKASDGTDVDDWTDEMAEKYSEEIQFVNAVIEQLGADEVNAWVHDSTNGLYNSFGEMSPSVFVATYKLLVQAMN